jgi:hypothetical protein
LVGYEPRPGTPMTSPARVLALAVALALWPSIAGATSGPGELRCREGWNGSLECRNRAGKVVLVCRPAFAGGGYECKPK